MNELQRIIARIEDMLNSGQIQGAKHLLYIAQGHAQSVTDLIADQVTSMTEQQLQINKLNADVAMYRERMEYWENRARTANPDDTLQELRAHGLEDHLVGSDQDA